MSGADSHLMDCPEMDYFMNGSLSDVVFVINGKSLPALQLILSLKNKVFRTMFSGKFKETKAKNVVIKDTTFEAFKTFIQFLYCDQLDLKEGDNFSLIEEICKLCDRYDAPRLHRKIGKHLMALEMTSDNIQSISEIAFNYKLKELMAKVMAFIDYNFDHFVNKSKNDLIELNDSTDNELIEVMANNYKKTKNDLKTTENKLKNIEKFKCNKCGIFSPSLGIICRHLHRPYTEYKCKICQNTVLQEPFSNL